MSRRHCKECEGTSSLNEEGLCCGCSQDLEAAEDAGLTLEAFKSMYYAEPRRYAVLAEGVALTVWTIHRRRSQHAGLIVRASQRGETHLTRQQAAQDLQRERKHRHDNRSIRFERIP